MQACVQTSHINFGKNILAQRRHCILNVLLPVHIITHCYKNSHNVTSRNHTIALIFHASGPGHYISRQWAVNVILYHTLFSD